MLRLRLAKPLVTSHQTVSDRAILVLSVTVDMGGSTAVGYGEVAPLAGWTSLSVDHAVQVLSTMAQSPACQKPFRLANDGLNEMFSGLRDTPSVRFGLELALLDALARHADCPLREVLAPPGHRPSDRVELQYACGIADIDETVERAGRAVESGYSHLKLKVGASDLDAEVRRLKAVRKEVAELGLRLDANGAFDFSEARRFIDRTEALGIDLFEQPLAAADLSGLNKLADISAIDIGADESCAPIARARQLIEAGRIDALVIKPAAVGGLLPTISLIEAARERNIRVVLSTLLESAIGRRAIAELAAAHPYIAGPQGLATGDWFVTDVTDTPDSIADGHWLLDGQPGIGFSPRVEGQPCFDAGGPS